MKILLAIDGSPCSETAAGEVARRKWDADSQLRIVSVVETPIAFAAEPAVAPASYYEELDKIERAKAREAIELAVAKLQGTEASRDLHITTDVLSGSPKRDNRRGGGTLRCRPYRGRLTRLPQLGTNAARLRFASRRLARRVLSADCAREKELKQRSFNC